MPRAARAIVLILAIGGVAACSKEVSSGDIEEKVREGIAAQTGATPESVECEDDLSAEVGDTTRCVLIADDGTRIGATVTATAVEGDQVSFDILVDEEPLE